MVELALPRNRSLRDSQSRRPSMNARLAPRRARQPGLLSPVLGCRRRGRVPVKFAPPGSTMSVDDERPPRRRFRAVRRNVGIENLEKKTCPLFQ